MTTVVNIRHSAYDIYIGRANGKLSQSKWANPWVIGKDGTREEVIQKYEVDTRANKDLMAVLPELRDKRLGCWCKNESGEGQACHGDVLVKLLRELDGEREQVVAPAVVKESKPIISSLPDTDILPLFSTDNSLGGTSVLTLVEAGKAIPEEPTSICDIAKAHFLSVVTIVDDRIDGYQDAVEHIQNTKIAQLVFGLKIVCCADHEDKTDASLCTESNIVIFTKSVQGYYDLLKIHNAAATTDFYYQHRTSWKRLKQMWTPSLILAIPFFSGFLAKNSLTLSSVIPDFPIPAKEVLILREVDSELPFASIIDSAIDQFVAKNGAQIQKSKSIYYPTAERFKSHMLMKCIDNRSTFDKPQADHLSSNRFSWERYVELIKEVS